MKSKSIACLMTFFSLFMCAQVNEEYLKLTKKAYSFYKEKNYHTAAVTYEEGFEILEGKAILTDRYNCACAWALSGNSEKSFYHLKRIADIHKYSDLIEIRNDSDFLSLHSDPRWKEIIQTIKTNKENIEARLDKKLSSELSSIRYGDQQYRQQLKQTEKEFGANSKELNDLWSKINKQDSVNRAIVCRILDTHGWLGKDVVGQDGSSALFLVIQHSDQSTQEKYLPMMREAVKKGNAYGADLAMLEDRVALGQGRRQLYGTQIGRDPESLLYYVSPLEDPDHVDERRKSVGLPGIAAYVAHWDIVWNVEQYKKELPAIELKRQTRSH